MDSCKALTGRHAKHPNTGTDAKFDKFKQEFQIPVEFADVS